jgi:predicted RNA-binding protein associated with RNAse of E/G family
LSADDFTVYKCNHQGELVWHYSGTVIDRGPTWVCLQAVFQREAIDLGVVVFEPGDVFTEWFYSDRWYNVFRIQDGREQRLKGWYCNVTRPAVIGADSVCADDLLLDVFVTPDARVILLDEEEFNGADLPLQERIAAVRAVEMIRLAVATGEGPFEELLSG